MAGAQHLGSSSTAGGRASAASEPGLEPELELRIEILEHREEQPAALTARDWRWIAILTLVVPAILLAIGWSL